MFFETYRTASVGAPC